MPNLHDFIDSTLRLFDILRALFYEPRLTNNLLTLILTRRANIPLTDRLIKMGKAYPAPPLLFLALISFSIIRGIDLMMILIYITYLI